MEVTETLQFLTAKYCPTDNHEISLALDLVKRISLIKVFLLSVSLRLCLCLEQDRCHMRGCTVISNCSCVGDQKLLSHSPVPLPLQPQQYKRLWDTKLRTNDPWQHINRDTARNSEGGGPCLDILSINLVKMTLPASLSLLEVITCV